MRILVLNSGSSSVKYQLFDLGARSLLAGGAAERIGTEGAQLIARRRQRDSSLSESVIDCALPDHAVALDRIMSELREAGLGEIELDGIGHRVVHGGDRFRVPALIDAEVIERIRALFPLAPLHNPANLLGIEVSLACMPDVPQIAVFDTAFHHSLPARTYRYAVPEEWYSEHGVRRYGFHGTSYARVAKQSALLLGRPVETLNLIALHLGNGASAAAIENGQSIDTSMGMTPLEGLVMGTRSGDLDPATLLHVAQRTGASLADLHTALNEQSGLTGLCGAADVRDVLLREQAGDSSARLALDVYVHRIRKYIGAYTAILGRVDAIAFTAGVGENSAEIRRRVCKGLENIGITLDVDSNEKRSDHARAIQHESSRVAVLVVPTSEELEIAEQTAQCIGATR